MKLALLASLAALGREAAACAGHGPSLHRMRANVGSNTDNMLLTKRQSSSSSPSPPPLQQPTNQDDDDDDDGPAGKKPWTPARNKRQMQLSDDAFNARDLRRFNHGEGAVMHYPGGVTMGLAEHLDDMRTTYSVSGIALHNHDYRIIFAEGNWTVTVVRASGVQDGPLDGLDGGLLPPTGKPYEYDFMTVARCEGGWMVEEFLWPDSVTMYRQLGVLPGGPPAPSRLARDLELGPGAPLSLSPPSAASSGSGEDEDTDTAAALATARANKAAAAAADQAFNAGNFTAAGLRLAPGALVYGLSDEPLDVAGYTAWLASMRASLPDLRLGGGVGGGHDDNNTIIYIAEGDWTATVATLSGSHTGADLAAPALPAYLTPGGPVAPSGKTFSLLNYAIARWQGGQIVGMRFHLDSFGLCAMLGIPL